MAHYQQGTVQKREAASRARLNTHGALVYGAEHEGQYFQCPQRRQVPSREQRLPKETLEEILKATERKRAANSEPADIVFNGPRKANVREEVRAASSTL